MGKRRLGIVLTAMLVAVGCSDAGVDSTPTATAPPTSVTTTAPPTTTTTTVTTTAPPTTAPPTTTTSVTTTAPPTTTPPTTAPPTTTTTTLPGPPVEPWPEPFDPTIWPTHRAMQAAIAANCPPGEGLDFSGQDLSGQDFIDESLRCADFTGVDLRGANFRDADLEYADLDGALVDETTELMGYVFISHLPPESSGSDRFSHTMCQQDEWFLLGSYLDGDREMQCNNVGLNGIEQVLLHNCSDGRDFSTMELAGMDFSNLDLTCSDFSYADLRGADLSGSNLANSVFWETDLTGADLSDASFVGARFGQWGTGVQQADLRGADLSGQDLGFSLFGSDLRGADLTGVSLSGETRCGNGDYPWPIGAPPESVRPEDMRCTGIEPLGPAAPLPDPYPGPTFVLGNERSGEAAVRLDGSWDACPRLITDEDVTPFMRACLELYAEAGRVYLTYHPFSWVEAGTAGWQGIVADYPSIIVDGLMTDFDGETGFDPTPSENGWIRPPRLSNASDNWLEFMLGVIRTQVGAGTTGIAFDEGWGSLGPGRAHDFGPAVMAGFREYLEARYTPDQLAAKGISDITSFDWLAEVRATPVFVDTQSDPGQYFTARWWSEVLGRPVEAGETWTLETFKFTFGDTVAKAQPLVGLVIAETPSDLDYFNRMLLREAYEAIRDTGKAAGAEAGHPWYLSINGYNDLGWGNAAVTAAVADLPMGELSTRDARWPERNFTSFFKAMAGMGKRFSPMFYPGQALTPQGDNDTPLVVTFLADVYASGGVAQSQDTRDDDAVERFFNLIQSDPGLFATTDNEVGLYYSLGNHMGDVGRQPVGVGTFYGAARLLEDSHLSYDVLYQGDPDMGPGTVRWVDRQVTPEQLAGYSLVVLPNTRHMTDAEVATLQGYLDGGGRLVVFGEAGTRDFSYPDQGERSITWTGDVLMLPGGDNLASRYDGDLAPSQLADFQRELATAFGTDDPMAELGPLVHVHRFRDDTSGREILHLVNFDWDPEADLIRPVEGALIAVSTAFDPLTEVRWATPDDPEGRSLDYSVVGGMLNVRIPRLDAYGVLTVTAP